MKNIAANFQLSISLSLFFFLISTNPALAQLNELFFSETSIKEAKLNSEQTKHFNKSKLNTKNKSVNLIKIKKLKQALKDNNLKFILPNEEEVFEAKSNYFQYFENNIHGWGGRLNNRTGSVAIVERPEGLFGSIQFDNRYFMILPLKEGYCILVESVNAIQPSQCNQNSSFNENYSLNNYDVSLPCSLNDGSNCSAIIDVLVLVTYEAQTWIVSNWGASSIPFFDFYLTIISSQILYASGIPNKSIRTKSILYNYNHQWPSGAGTLSIDADLEVYSARTDVHNLRNLYRGDIVLMLDSYNTWGFLGYAKTLIIDNANSYAIADIGSAFSPLLTFIHELGHILGCRHDRSDDNHASCGHGFRFNDANGVPQQTIMSTQLDYRIGNFSNPNVFFNGKATGNSNNDNARVIRNTGCIVANFRASPEMTIDISVGGDFCFEYYQTYTATVAEAAPGYSGYAPFQYSWYLQSSSYFDPTTALLLNTSNSVTLYPSHVGQWLHLQVVSNDGIVRVISNEVVSNNCMPMIISGQSKEDDINSIRVFPNPTTNKIQVQSNLKLKTGKTEILLYDVLGKIVKTYSIDNYENSLLNTSIDISDLNNGTYTLRLYNEAKSETIKIIKNQ